MENATPMLRQYLDIKKAYPGTILLFRLGDFYEMFMEDAVTGARELEITLTARQKDSPNPIPMCGVPHHAAATYISRLVKKGYRVAICEQTEEPKKGVKLVKRDVVRVITPGTAIDEQLIQSKDAVYLAAVSRCGDGLGVAFLDLSSGQFLATEFTASEWPKAKEQLEAFAPREILVTAAERPHLEDALGLRPDASLFEAAAARQGGPAITAVDPTDLQEARKLLTDQFEVKDLDAFGIASHNTATTAAALCLRYARDTQRNVAAHINSIEYLETAEQMILDAVTLANLEIVGSRSENSKQCLFNVLDECVTGMGSRLLKQWLLRPSLRRSEIETRLAAVEELGNISIRETLRFLFKSVNDLERLTGKVNLGTATPRDLLALNQSLAQAAPINEQISSASSLLLQVLAENIFELPEIRDLIGRAIAENPPANVSDTGIIRDGFNAELDELREISSSGKNTIAQFVDRERERTGISTLKVGFNNVFGYYIEVSKGAVAKVPNDYQRRQTLANAERYITPELKEWEDKVLGAEERIAKLEAQLFAEVRTAIAAETRKLQSTARALATLDVLCSLAEVAAVRNYVRPVLHDGDAIEIKSGRHPVVEVSLRDAFVSNDIVLNNSTDRLLIITGANMGGKSTILRQTALIQIMAQIGSFVPATSARLPIVDRVWTRVGASDDLASGRSTFMVEMTETAAILHNATPRSLILLDEIGRGTSTFDGLSIAWAVAEYLHNSDTHAAKTLFATHYHELTELAENLPGAKNYQVTAGEREGKVVFFHKLAAGKASKSYGIAVGRLAGLPASVIGRAKDVLTKLEQYELAVFADERPTGIARAATAHAASNAAAQVSLFTAANETAIDSLRTVDLDTISPTEAKQILTDLKNKIV
jgi:DNA mismatch repair protein MutS